MKLILGSSSKYRKKILEGEGYVFEVISPDVDEKAIRVDDNYERPLVLARAKMDAVLAKIGNANEETIVIASDQVVVCHGELREKPESEMETRKWLADYSAGAVPECVTAIVVANTKTKERFEGVDVAKVFFKHLPEDAIENFIKKDEPLTRAGGFGIKYTELGPYVEKVEGTEDSVTGMPLQLLKKLLLLAHYS